MSREDHDWRRRPSWRADAPTPVPVPTPVPWAGPIPLTTTALPDPPGSPKQAAWAREVRAKRWAGLLKLSKRADPASAGAVMRRLASADAAFWLDNRGLSPGKLWLAATGGTSRADPPAAESRTSRVAHK